MLPKGGGVFSTEPRFHTLTRKEIHTRNRQRFLLFWSEPKEWDFIRSSTVKQLCMQRGVLPPTKLEQVVRFSVDKPFRGQPEKPTEVGGIISEKVSG